MRGLCIVDSSCWHLCQSFFLIKKNSKVHVLKPPYLILGPYEQSYPFQGAYSSDWLTEKQFSCGVGTLGGQCMEKLRDIVS